MRAARRCAPTPSRPRPKTSRPAWTRRASATSASIGIPTPLCLPPTHSCATFGLCLSTSRGRSTCRAFPPCCRRSPWAPSRVSTCSTCAPRPVARRRRWRRFQAGAPTSPPARCTCPALRSCASTWIARVRDASTSCRSTRAASMTSSGSTRSCSMRPARVRARSMWPTPSWSAASPSSS